MSRLPAGIGKLETYRGEDGQLWLAIRRSDTGNLTAGFRVCRDEADAARIIAAAEKAALDTYEQEKDKPWALADAAGAQRRTAETA